MSHFLFFFFFRTKHLCDPRLALNFCSSSLHLLNAGITTVYTRVGKNMYLKTPYILSKDLKHVCVFFSSKKITIHANIVKLNKLLNYCKYHSSIKNKRFLWDLRHKKHTFLFLPSTYYYHNITPCETGPSLTPPPQSVGQSHCLLQAPHVNFWIYFNSHMNCQSMIYRLRVILICYFWRKFPHEY